MSGESWIVTTIRSEVNRDLTTTTNLVRCVRDPMGRTDRNVSTNATTVTVTETGLMWERNPSATEVSHAAATSYCAGLSLGGFTDWRLPSRNELVSIVDVTRATPAIDSTVFGYPTAINYWWTSTIDVFTSRPWFLAFRETGYTYSDPISMAGARCVRP